MQLRQLAAIKARQHDRAARMARRRGDQPVDQTRGLDLVAPAERLDDALHVAATLAGVLDEVEILVGSALLDADEHGAAPCSWQSTTILCVTTSKIATIYCNRPDGLAPHHGATCRTPSNSADLTNHFPQNRGSWAWPPPVPFAARRRSGSRQQISLGLLAPIGPSSHLQRCSGVRQNSRGR